MVFSTKRLTKRIDELEREVRNIQTSDRTRMLRERRRDTKENDSRAILEDFQRRVIISDQNYYEVKSQLKVLQDNLGVKIGGRIAGAVYGLVDRLHNLIDPKN